MSGRPMRPLLPSEPTGSALVFPRLWEPDAGRPASRASSSRASRRDFRGGFRLAVAESTVQLVTITGEAGVGKSIAHLHEFEERTGAAPDYRRPPVAPLLARVVEALDPRSTSVR